MARLTASVPRNVLEGVAFKWGFENGKRVPSAENTPENREIARKYLGATDDPDDAEVTRASYDRARRELGVLAATFRGKL